MASDPAMTNFHNAFVNKDLAKLRLVWENLLLVVKKLPEEELNMYIEENANQRCQLSVNWAWV